MRFVLLNQTFHPDVMATGQYLAEVAAGLAEGGHEVIVLTSRRAYDAPGTLFAGRESWRGVRVLRVGSTGLGKGAKWRRAADFASFFAACTLRLAFLPRPDAVVALTSPPLISVLGAAFARLHGCRFYYWVMDFNPDEALAAGWLEPGSLSARLLEGLSRFSLRRAARIIALDRFMRDRIVAKGISLEKVAILSTWAQDIRFDAGGRERFRQAHGLQDKFVVMYSGNHSPCHPLDTLLGAAQKLSAQTDLVFCFIGGGSEWVKLEERSAAGTMPNVRCLPYQARGQLAGSLSAADLHVVVLGDEFVGLVHPCKIYNVLQVGTPLLYIGPAPSHVTELAEAAKGHVPFYQARHGDVSAVVKGILQARERRQFPSGELPPPLRGRVAAEAMVPSVMEVLGGGGDVRALKR